MFWPCGGESVNWDFVGFLRKSGLIADEIIVTGRLQ